MVGPKADNRPSRSIPRPGTDPPARLCRAGQRKDVTEQHTASQAQVLTKHGTDATAVYRGIRFIL